MVGVAVYCVAFASAGQFDLIRGDALATLGYVANWREVFSHQNYFALFSAPSPLNHTWSLAIEEQFYVVWPLVFVGLLARFRRRQPVAVLVASLGLAATSTVLMFVLYDVDDVARVYFGTDTCATAILLGAALAAWLAMFGPTVRRERRVALEVVALVGVAFLALCWARLDGQSSSLYHGGFLLCAVAATAIIAAAVHPEPGPISRVLSWKPLCALGLISYGVYLYHWPIDVALDAKEMGFHGWPLFGFQTVLTLVVATLSYKIVEQPIRHGAISAVQLRKLTPAIAVALIAAILATTTGGTTPIDDKPLRHPIAAARSAFESAPAGSRRVMTVGDSVAHSLGKAFPKINTDPPLAVFNAGITGCAFLPGVTRARYHNSLGATMTQREFPCNPPWEADAIEAFKPDVVLWIVNNPFDAMYANGRWLETCSDEYAAIYQRSLIEELAILGVGGAKVVMTTEVYPRYLFAAEDGPTDCENRLRRVVVARTGVQLIDLQGFVCPDGECLEKKNGVTLRIDGEHYEGAGGKLVAEWLYDQIGSATS